MIDLQNLLTQRLPGPVHDFVANALVRVATYHRYLSMTIRCDWHVAVENALEDMHVPTIHAETFAKLKLQRISQERYEHCSIARYVVGDDLTRRSLTRLAKWFPHAAPTVYEHLFIYPHTCLSSLGGFTYALQTYEPWWAGMTDFKSRLYGGVTTAKPEVVKAFFDDAADFNRRVFEEDAAVCERILKWNPGADFLHPVEEQRIIWFREQLDKETDQ